MIIQNVGREKGETDVTFTVPGTDLLRSIDLLEAAKDKIGFNRIISDDKVAKISVVGVGRKSHAGVASTMFRALADRAINLQAISTSKVKVSVLIDEDETELAVRVLHTDYGPAADQDLFGCQRLCHAPPAAAPPRLGAYQDEKQVRREGD